MTSHRFLPRLIIAGTLVAVAITNTACTVNIDGPEGPSELPEGLDEGWNEILTGGDTICSRGTEYAFYVRPGTVNRVVVEFIGGGACWDEFTCSVADAIFQPDIESVRAAMNAGIGFGIYDHERDDNPFKDWYHVVIPYCTGDVHWGDNVATYGAGETEVTINHKGAVNSRTVLNWVYQNFAKPEQLFVTGCSAGSYGSTMWAPHIIQHYPESRVMQFGDSGAGVITQTFFEDSFPSWKAEDSFPTWIEGLDPTVNNLYEMELADLYVNMSKHYPDHQFSQYNTAFDENQVFYFKAMGGTDAADWSEQMYASIDKIEQNTNGFASFIPSGEQHCILGYPNFYTVNVGGTKLVDWLSQMLEGQAMESLKCDDCTTTTP